MANAFAQALGLRLVKATVLAQDTVPFPDLSPAFLRQARALPLQAPPNGAGDCPAAVLLAMADPSDEETVEAVALFTGCPVVRFRAAVLRQDGQRYIPLDGF
jgi:Type II secretion system (T2SS), protein E, N-terminal domain